MTELREKILDLKTHLQSVIVGQDDLIKKMLITLLSSGHALLEGAPGLAKTKAIKTLADSVSADFSRIQFTPDLLPSDITGSDIYLASTGSFDFKKGPVFANFVLADEINRAPAKVQSALLEAMAENQVTVGGKEYKLPDLFMVMATQNPIEHEGTYNLPEAQLDRFLLYIKIDQPDGETEKKILSLVRAEDIEKTELTKKETYQKITIDEIKAAKKEVLKIHTSEA
ncbi:MAG TPA: AAA family ATPase, partial [Alphaproteobacteria bacterium]|nr:AAA family ATPase [Alphaproteobacteria bacterium]